MQTVVDDVFYSIYQYLGFGIVFAVICMIALPEVERNGLKKTLIYQWHIFKANKLLGTQWCKKDLGSYENK